MTQALQGVGSSSYSTKAYEKEFECHGVFLRGYAEKAGMGISLMIERSNGFGRGRKSQGFTLLNYGRLDTLETRLAISKEAYRLVREMAGQKDLGPDAMPDMAVSAWVSRVCDELCR